MATVVATFKEHKPKDFHVLYLEQWFPNGEFNEDTILLDGWKKCIYIEFTDKKGIAVMNVKR